MGYTVAYQNHSQIVKAYQYYNIPGLPHYQTEDYNIYDVSYRIVPFSAGMEYIFENEKSSPYAIIEGSYNAYDAKFETSPITTGAGGYYNSYDEIPPAYQNNIPSVPGTGSFGLSLGAGLKINLSNFFDLDLRYMYQFNSTIVNMHKILIGFIF